MDGGRKPKRRIIDNTSVPISRRAGQKRSEREENNNQNTKDTTQTGLVRNSASPDKTNFGNAQQNSAFVKVLENLSGTSTDETENLDYKQSEITTLQYSTSVESNDGKDIDLSKGENVTHITSKSMNELEEVNERLNDEKKHSINDEITIIHSYNKNDEKSDIDIFERVEIKSEQNMCTSLRCINKTDSKSVVEIGKADVAYIDNNRMNENQEISERTKDLAPNNHTCITSPDLLDCKSQNVKENNSSSYKDIESKFDSPLERKNGLSVHNGQIGPLFVPGQSKFKENDCHMVSKNPLFSIQEKMLDESKSPDVSNMFEIKNFLTDMDGMTENNLIAEVIKSDVEFRKPDINLCQFFGEDDELSSIRNVSSVGQDLLEDNLACHTGLSLFDEPNVIKESSKYFAFNLLEAKDYDPEIQEHEENLFVSPGTKDPFSIELELTTPLDDKGFEEPAVSMVDLYEAVVHGYRDSQEDDILSEEKETNTKDVYSGIMEGSSGSPRLLSVEEKWQIIFNEKTRAPIYAVTQYIDYLNQFVNGQNATPRNNHDVIKKESIHPVSYLLRKLKLDLKMSYESFVEEFIKPRNNGMSLLIKLLKSIQNTGSQQSGSTNMTQLKNYKKTLTDEHDCLLCIKYSLRLKKSLHALLDMNYGLETVAMAVISTYTKSRGTAIEILTVCLSAEEGFTRTLDCFTYIQLKIGEPVRFKSLVNMMNVDSHHNTIFKVCTMKFLNCLLDASTNTNIRVFLQHELETAGLDIDYIEQKTTGTGLEFDDLRHELTEWKRKYINVDTILSQRETIAQRARDPATQQTVLELQAQLKRMTDDKSYLEYQLQAVSTELRNRYEELLKRTPIKIDASTQSDIETSRESVGCQCNIVADDDRLCDGPLRTAADYFGWKDVYINGARNAYYPVCEHENLETENEAGDTEQCQDVSISDDDGVDKVQHWLRSHCGSSESENKLLPEPDNPSVSECSSFYFKRNSLTRRKVRKTEFPGNWKLIPKSIEQFPSRFSVQQCHQTNCDRCDLRNRPENSLAKSTTGVKKFELELRLNDLVKNTKRSDVRSQSSDSAIGGSGEERPWGERRIPMVQATQSEEELLQDLVQPDDSASACPTSEPYPDYSPSESKFGTQRSFTTELSQVLREFEGNLLMYDSPATASVGAVENYISLGEV